MILAFEIGGTKLQAALGTRSGEVVTLRAARVARERGAEGIMEWVVTIGAELMRQAEAEVSAVCVGFGGPVDSAAGKVLVSHQIEGWDGLDLAARLERTWGRPVVLENDSNAAGWAEYVLGAGRGTRHFVYMNIGSGIGGAVVVDGKLHRGQGLGAGEVGHTRVSDAWSDSRAPVRVEDVCSGWNIERRLRFATVPQNSMLLDLCETRQTQITCAMLGDAAAAGDAFAVSEIDRIAQCIGQALANVITLLHPERIAIGGGVAALGQTLLIPVRNYVEEYVFGVFRGRYEIVCSELQEQVVIRGALLLGTQD